MATMNLDGPHRLTFETVSSVVSRGLPGVFALGSEGADEVFYVNFIGRADHDLHMRLLAFIGSDKSFKFQHASNAHEAFLRECELFHKFRPIGNRLHPTKPATTDWTCPRCAFLGRDRAR